jgi:hypothetical protein
MSHFAASSPSTSYEDIVASIAIGDHMLSPELREKTFELYISFGGDVYRRLVETIGVDQANITFKLTEDCFNHANKTIEEKLKKIWRSLKEKLDSDDNNEIDGYEFTVFCVKTALDDSLHAYDVNINDGSDFADTFHKLRLAFAANYSATLQGLERTLGQILV